MQASFDAATAGAQWDDLRAFESLAQSNDRVHALAGLAEAVDAAREAWLDYRGDDLQEEERLHAEWRRLRDEFKSELEACWGLLHASEHMPEYPAREGR